MTDLGMDKMPDNVWHDGNESAVGDNRHFLDMALVIFHELKMGDQVAKSLPTWKCRCVY